MKVSWMLIVKQRHLRNDLLNYTQIEHYVLLSAQTKPEFFRI